MPSTPPVSAKEAQRLQSLTEHSLLDTLPEEVYDDITRLAAEICGTPMAAINLIAEDRHWPKSTYGLDKGSLPLEHSICAHTILTPNDTLVVPDLRYDDRFYGNPLTVGAPYLKFYAGVPVKDAEGLPLGALCVLDSRPRELPEHKLESLQALAKLVNTHFQLRRKKMLLEQKQQQVVDAQPIVNSMMSNITLLEATGSLTANAGNVAAHLAALREDINSLYQLLDRR